MTQTSTLSSLKSNRKSLRKSATPQEIILWSRIRRNELGVKFRRQHSIGNSIIDFYCSEKKLAIELDGWQHKENISHDSERTEFLERHGIRVLRFWNNEINEQLDSVLLKIEDAISSQPLRPAQRDTSPFRKGEEEKRMIHFLKDKKP